MAEQCEHYNGADTSSVILSHQLFSSNVSTGF